MRDGMKWKIVKGDQVAALTLHRRGWLSWQVDAEFTSLKDNGAFALGWVHPVFAMTARKAVARANQHVIDQPSPPDFFDSQEHVMRYQATGIRWVDRLLRVWFGPPFRRSRMSEAEWMAEYHRDEK